jgi:uncharacterized protein YjbJ (UPF0337 family)
MDKNEKLQGIEDQVTGTAKEMKGKLRGDLGDATDNGREHVKGRVEQFEGKVEKNIGKLEQDDADRKPGYESGE